jgi:hypothetical protein
MSIFVETDMDAPMTDLWARTQDPGLHQRWDLRFTDIAYAASEDELQRFTYATRLAFGVTIRGVGETIAERVRDDGSRVSALRFWSSSRLSLIGEGRGYWMYTPTATGVRFRTVYDYSTRFGVAGRFLDRVAFRPLIGWATAWSFDRLRLWLERGIDPASSARLALVHGLARVGLAAIFAWHGLVPKLLGPDPTELALVGALGASGESAVNGLRVLGAAEIGLAIALLLTWHRPWLAWLAFAFAIGATAVTAISYPQVVGAAFNPVTLNLGLGMLATIDLLTFDGIPSAGRCRRTPSPTGTVTEISR